MANTNKMTDKLIQNFLSRTRKAPEIPSCKICNSTELVEGICSVCGVICNPDFLNEAEEEITAPIKNEQQYMHPIAGVMINHMTYEMQRTIEYRRIMQASLARGNLFVNQSIIANALQQFLDCKHAGNHNRADINRGLMAAFLMKSAMDCSIDIPKKRICYAFDIDLKHFARGIQIMISGGIQIHYDLDKLVLNYIGMHFDILGLPIRYRPIAQILALLIVNHLQDVSNKYVPHSIASWVTFFICCHLDLFPELKERYKDQPTIYQSKIKCMFDNQKTNILDKPGTALREHICSSVNLTKIDKLIRPYRPMLCNIVDRLVIDSRIKIENRYLVEEITL